MSSTNPPKNGEMSSPFRLRRTSTGRRTPRIALRRAETVKQFLVELGVPETSVKVATVGAEGMLCDEATPECQQLNRRVHLEIRKLRTAAAPAVRPVIATDDTLQTPQSR